MLLRLIVAALLACSLNAQNVSVTLASDGPPSVTNVSGGVIGNRGGTTYFYWVVARYPVGDAQAFGPFSVFNGPATLSVSDFISLTWNTQQGATSYAVLRSPNGNTPLSNNTCAACLVGTTTSNSISDTGSALTSFTRIPNPGRVSTELTVNNRDYAAPRTRLGEYFAWQPIGTGLLADRPTNCTGLIDTYICVGADCAANPSVYYCIADNSWSLISGGGGVPANPDRSVQYNNAGSFGGNANFTWDLSGILNNLAGYTAGDGVVTGQFTLLEGTAPSAPPNSGDWRFYVDTTNNDFKMIPDAGTTYFFSRSAAQLDCTAIANGFVTTDVNGIQSCASIPAGSDPTDVSGLDYAYYKDEFYQIDNEAGEGGLPWGIVGAPLVTSGVNTSFGGFFGADQWSSIFRWQVGAGNTITGHVLNRAGGFTGQFYVGPRDATFLWRFAVGDVSEVFLRVGLGVLAYQTAYDETASGGFYGIDYQNNTLNCNSARSDTNLQAQIRSGANTSGLQNLGIAPTVNDWIWVRIIMTATPTVQVCVDKTDNAPTFTGASAGCYTESNSANIPGNGILSPFMIYSTCDGATSGATMNYEYFAGKVARFP